MIYEEINFDGLVGNTHNYAGLSFGNVASDSNKGRISSPKAAALQGLAKMKALSDMGLKQGVLPPHIRPFMPFLRHIGFCGDDASVLRQAKQHPHYLNAAHSASNMWVANAATIAPSADSADGRVHFTPANLSSMLHRSIEHPQTAQALKSIFADDRYFAHHQALQGQIHGDEGAANHTRFCRQYGDKGLHFFVYGQSVFQPQAKPKAFPARQTRESFEAIARLHQLDKKQCVFAQQHPDVIDKGVFHNDVISVGNRHILLTHEKAFVNPQAVYAELSEKYHIISGDTLNIVEVPDALVSVEDAVNSYLFNSQLVSTDNGMVLIAPSNCEEHPAVNTYLSHLIDSDAGIDDVQFYDVKQSMANGGGPACLRLRVVLSEEELAHLSGRVMLDDALYGDLVAWVEKHYRDTLSPQELGDIALLHETTVALTELSDILQLPDLYALGSSTDE
ncbi:MAG: N-succinylarginine dihydrolase [Gammaproteobacteria bacterium]|nr:MAG: N-succinylarginine dihydrolase [Gammaproteobacteria bacterium]